MSTEGITMPPSELVTCLSHLVNNPEALPNVALILGKSRERVLAHRALLAVKSPVFR